MGKKSAQKEEKPVVQDQEEFNDSDYEDKYPDDLPSDSELKEMVTGDATTCGLLSFVFVLLLSAAVYSWWMYFG